MSNETEIESALSNIDNDFVRALAEPARIEILKLLVLQGACDVGSLAEKMPQDRSVISRHLATMKQAGLLNAQKEGRHVVYRINGNVMLEKSERLVESIRQCIKLDCC
jgi:DNA-binding transcriptional ArsR family regulator